MNLPIEVVERRLLLEAIGRVTVEAVSAEAGLIGCYAALTGDPIPVWGKSGGPLLEAIRKIKGPSEDRDRLVQLAEQCYVLYQERNQIIHGVIADGRSVRMRPRVTREDLARDVTAGLVVRPADPQTLFDLGNRFNSLAHDIQVLFVDLAVPPSGVSEATSQESTGVRRTAPREEQRPDK